MKNPHIRLSRRQWTASATAALLVAIASAAPAATYVVDNAGDVSDGDFSAGQLTLREAITNANALAGADTIQFDAAITVVTLTSILPSITEAVTIDGTVNASYVEINGSTNAVSGFAALHVSSTSNGTNIGGLEIQGFTGRGIQVGGSNTVVGSPGKGNVIRNCTQEPIFVENGSSATTIQSNIIGFQRDGTTPSTNAFGVRIGGTGSLLGGDAANERNTISGSTGSNGVNVLGGSGHVITGNNIGTDVNGTGDFGHSAHGIYCQVNGTVIGGPGAFESNVIAGNGLNGIHLFNTTSFTIENNIIGLNRSGLAAVPNAIGIQVLSGCSNATIRGNYIAGNTADGINNAGDNIAIHGNIFGLGDGDAVFANGGDGIELASTADGTVIGTSDSNDRNVIAGNAHAGVRILGTNTTVRGNYIGTKTDGGSAAGQGNTISGNTFSEILVVGSEVAIRGNRLGTSADGNKALGIGQGIRIDAPADENVTIGGSGAGDGNQIAGSVGNGIQIDGDFVTVEGNVLGLNAAGDAIVGISQDAINVGSTSLGCTIIDNVISGAVIDGVEIAGGSISVEQNRIGTNAAGDTDFGNGSGVRIGPSASEVSVLENVISGNSGDGLETESSNITVWGNIIGLAADGNTTLGNGGNGIDILPSASGVAIGGAGASEGNTISANGLSGICIAAPDTVITGNRIGTDTTGAVARGNIQTGITVLSTATDTVIGGTADPGEANIIAGNNESGVSIEGATGVLILGNTIGTNGSNADLGNRDNGILVNAPATADLDTSVSMNLFAFNDDDHVNVSSNATGVEIGRNSFDNNCRFPISFNGALAANDPLDADTGANNQQNFPEIDPTTPTDSMVTGSMSAAANATYRVHLFSSAAGHSSGNGAGAQWEGTALVTTDGSGAGTWSMPVTAFPTGRILSALAVGPTGDTSHFSPNVAVAPNVGVED